MGFLAPIFFAGLAGLAIPLLVHLVHKERKDAFSFPSLMFLARTPYPFSARQRIRDWLLFLLRAALVALVVFAFARPVITKETVLTPGVSGRETVLLLDRSFSMRYAGRWQEARREVDRVIADHGVNDLLTIVPFDRRAAAVNDANADVASLRTAVDTIQLSDESTRLAPAVAVAQRILSASGKPRRRLIVVSDFQRTGWDLTDEVQLPEGTEVFPVDVTRGAVVDRAVRSVAVRRDPSGNPNRVVVSARITNSGPAVRAVRVTLDVGDREMDRRTIDIAADGGATVAFDAMAVPATPSAARVVLSADSLTGDDAFNFLLTRAPIVPVLLVEHRDASADRSLFLRRALEIGDEPAFSVRIKSSDAVGASDLVGQELVVLSDAGLPAGLAAGRLKGFVEQGGGLLNALGERTGDRSWPAAERALLPGPVAAPSDKLGAKGAVLGYVDRAHQALSVFSGASGGDLSGARFFRYRPIETDAQVLARFDDGAVALSEHAVGSGRVLTWASSFDGYWNDLPRQPVFLPFIHQVARYAASYREKKRSWSVGESVAARDLTDLIGVASTRWSVITPSGRREQAGGDAAASVELREAGFYQIRPGGSPNAAPRILAANVAPAEIDFATYDVTRLTNALTPVGTAAGASSPNELSLAEQEQKQSGWWYILIAAMAILLGESLLARRLTTAAGSLAQNPEVV